MVPGLGTPYPLGSLLPAVYQEDAVTMLLTAALDDVLAPVIATLDCLPAYLDPWLAPADFLDWLASWVGADLDENWPPERRRAIVATAVELYRIRGTVAGLRQHVELVTGGRVDVVDSGGVSWSTTPDTADVGDEPPSVTVRIGEPESVAVVDALVAAAKPVHVVHRVDVA
ncbi:MAG TPA: phage tail protein I [Pseudonocardiaceae bacterium]|nr:phage tail protein I [Pseudonocardiaceae bacterium]